MELELAKQGKELVLEHEVKMNIIKEEVERDIRSQLRRQAAAHSDHLQDMLSVQVSLGLLLLYVHTIHHPGGRVEEKT